MVITSWTWLTKFLQFKFDIKFAFVYVEFVTTKLAESLFVFLMSTLLSLRTAMKMQINQH